LWQGRSIQKQDEGEFFDCGFKTLKDGIELTELFKARRQLTERKSEEAIQTLLAANASIPSEWRYLYQYLLGRSYYSLALKLTPITGWVVQYREGYRKSGYAKAALASLKQAIVLKPSFTPAYAILIDHYLTGGEWTEGLHVADSLLKLMPHCAEAYRLHGQCLSHLDRPKAALVDYQRSLELNPSDPSVQFETGHLWLGLNENERAIESYNAALALGYEPAWACHSNIGNAYKKASKFQQAIDAFEESRRLGSPGTWCDEQIAICRQLQRSR
jgi:tetratricopeptide (TPR) repeat protein